MKVGLIDVDGHNFPSLPLMKLSAYHKRRGDSVEIQMPHTHYDIVYKSKVFDFTPEKDEPIFADCIIEGGTGYSLQATLPPEVESIPPDYSLYPQYDEAYGFLTRGCPNACPFCIVTQKEGAASVQVSEIKDFCTGQKTIKLLDPNLLACVDREQILQDLAEAGAWVDFTQGLDVRLIDKEVIQLLNKIKVKIVHFAWDNPGEDLTAQFRLFDKYSALTHYTRRAVYILTNYNSTHAEDLRRVYTLRDMGFNPYVMIYDKQNAPKQTIDLQRWVNARQAFRTVERFEDYKPPTKAAARDERQLSLFDV